jgi:hypothetical protein
MANIWGSLFRKKVDFSSKKVRFPVTKYLTLRAGEKNGAKKGV